VTASPDSPLPHPAPGAAERNVPTVDTPKIQLVSLRKSFRTDTGTLDVLADVSLAARPGEFVSIIGPSGCGKSTMFNVMAGLELPSAGEVLVDGVPATGHTEKFAYMPQKDLLFPWRRVIDNATLGLEVQGVSRRKAREQAAPLFETFGLAGFEQAYPFELSGGMRQRVALLRTVVQGRSVLLLDEPFGALDSLTRTEMQLWMETVWERYQWTVVLITHDIREAVFLSDRVFVLTARPARVRTEVPVTLPRPRSIELLADPAFGQLEADLFGALSEESRRARASRGESVA
jgi:ABC-type nitrate/sulfonate/bicarbonate transport system ATPase subunit